MSANKQKLLKLDYVTSAIRDVINDEASNQDATISNSVKAFNEYSALFQDKLLDFTIGENISKFGTRVMNGISQTRSFLHIMPTPGKKLVQQKADFFKQKIEAGEDVEKYTKLSKQSQMIDNFTETAMVFQTWRQKDKSLVDTFAMSQDLHEKIAAVHDPSTQKYNNAMMAIIAHEHDGHILAGDVENGKWNSGDSKNLSSRDLNVLFDLRINSGIKANGPNEGNALQEVMPKAVWGESIKKWLGSTSAIIETVHNSDGENINAEELKRNVINRTGDDIKDEDISKIIEQISVSETAKKIKNAIGESGSLNELIKPHREKATKIGKGFNLPRESIQELKNLDFNDWIDVMQKHIISYQNKETGGFAHDSIIDIQDTLKGLIVGNPDQGGGEGGESGDPSNTSSGSGEGPLEKGPPSPKSSDSDAYTDVHNDDVRAAKTKSQNARKNISSQIGDNRNAGKGSHSVDIELEPNKDANFQKGVKNVLRKFGNYLGGLKKQIERRTIPIVPPDQVGKIFNEYASGLRQSAQLPLGATTYKNKPRVTNGVIMTVTDESGSVSNKELATMKTAITDICDSQNLIAINVAASGDVGSAKIQAYQPGKTDKKEFIKRYKSGGTDDFLSGLYDLDEHMQNPKFKKNMDEALAHTDITSSDLLQFRDAHRINQMIFTDGGLFKKQLSPEKRSKWNEYASHFPEPPVSYISVTNSFRSPVKNGMNKLYNAYKFPLQ